MNKQRLAIFASGNGSNAVRIIEHFRNHNEIEVCAVVCNNPKAGVLERAANEDLHQILITNKEAADGKLLTELMHKANVDFIVLSGYLRMIPKALIHSYPKHIINIHPALLPKYGGAGMYGIHVHKAVKESGEKQSGITVHLVNEEYDKGEILVQHQTSLNSTDSVADIQKKVQSLEHEYFAQEIENYILLNNKNIFSR